MAYRNSLLLAALLGVATALVDSGPLQAAEPVRCTVILDEESGETLYRQGSCDQAFYPQSTFKLPLAMMGYDAGILKDEKTPRWDYQAKFERPKREQKATDPLVWERDSIVWYSQELTRKLGERAFADYVRRFGYGNSDVSGGLTEAWLSSSLKISPDEQVRFIRRFLVGGLPISEEAADKTRAIIPHFDAADGWDIQGKTGSGSLRDKAGKSDGNRPLGWFVGWATKGERRVIFARLLVDNKPQGEKPISYVVRDGLIADLPGLVGQL